MTILATPFPESYWVIPDQFLAGQYPGALLENEARRKIQALIKADISVYIDLTRENELNPYQPMLEMEAAEYGKPVSYLRQSIQDLGIPAPTGMKAILDTIDRQLEFGKKVYVHCWGGIGRTGTTVGCYLVRHGLTGQEALQQIAILRQNTPNWFRSSPETSEQIDMILNWEKGM
jgi:protein-tyrosine phosphatase